MVATKIDKLLLNFYVIAALLFAIGLIFDKSKVTSMGVYVLGYTLTANLLWNFFGKRKR